MTISFIPSKRFATITSVLLFLIAFTLWQVYDLIMLYISPPITVIYLLFLAVPTISLAMFLLFTKLARSTPEKQGYKKPTTLETSKCLLLSAVFSLIYIFVYLFPGFPTRSFNYSGISTSIILVVHRIASAILISFAAESIFRGYVFRNFLRKYGFFTSLYVSSILFGLYQVSMKDVIGATVERITIYAFTNVLPSFAAGLFLGFFFYKTGWSLLGPAMFRMGVQFFLDPLPIVSPASPPSWWMALTLEATSYVVLILILDTVIKEPRYLRRRYGLED